MNLPDEPTDIDSDEEDFYIAQGEWIDREIFNNESYWYPPFANDQSHTGERG